MKHDGGVKYVAVLPCRLLTLMTYGCLVHRDSLACIAPCQAAKGFLYLVLKKASPPSGKAGQHTENPRAELYVSDILAKNDVLTCSTPTHKGYVVVGQDTEPL